MNNISSRRKVFPTEINFRQVILNGKFKISYPISKLFGNFVQIPSKIYLFRLEITNNSIGKLFFLWENLFQDFSKVNVTSDRLDTSKIKCVINYLSNSLLKSIFEFFLDECKNVTLALNYTGQLCFLSYLFKGNLVDKSKIASVYILRYVFHL